MHVFKRIISLSRQCQLRAMTRRTNRSFNPNQNFPSIVPSHFNSRSVFLIATPFINRSYNPKIIGR